MVTTVSDIRLAPVGEDLTTDELGLAILRGIEKCFRVDKKLAVGQSLSAGEFGVLNAAGELERAGAVPASATYLVFSGSDRFDAKATGQLTLIMNSSLLVKSNKFNTAVSYAVGDFLCVKNLGAGESSVTKASAGEFAVGKVIEAASGHLIYELLPVSMKV